MRLGSLVLVECAAQVTSASAACKPSSVPPRRNGAAMAIHLGPPVARRLLRPTRGLGSAPAPGEPGIALLFGLAPGRACRVSLRLSPASSLWRWSSPRGGRELPATSRCGARTFLTPPGCPVDARPSGRLVDHPILVGGGTPGPSIVRRPCPLPSIHVEGR